MARRLSGDYGDAPRCSILGLVSHASFLQSSPADERKRRGGGGGGGGGHDVTSSASSIGGQLERRNAQYHPRVPARPATQEGRATYSVYNEVPPSPPMVMHARFQQPRANTAPPSTDLPSHHAQPALAMFSGLFAHEPYRPVIGAPTFPILLDRDNEEASFSNTRSIEHLYSTISSTKGLNSVSAHQRAKDRGSYQVLYTQGGLGAWETNTRSYEPPVQLIGSRRAASLPVQLSSHGSGASELSLESSTDSNSQTPPDDSTRRHITPLKAIFVSKPATGPGTSRGIAPRLRMPPSVIPPSPYERANKPPLTSLESRRKTVSLGGVLGSPFQSVGKSATDTGMISGPGLATIPSGKASSIFSQKSGGRIKSVGGATERAESESTEDWQKAHAQHKERILRARSIGKITVSLPEEIEEARAEAARSRKQEKDSKDQQMEENTQVLYDTLRVSTPKVDARIDNDTETLWKDRRKDLTRQRNYQHKQRQEENLAALEKLDQLPSPTARLFQTNKEDERRKKAFLEKKRRGQEAAKEQLIRDNMDHRHRVRATGATVHTKLSAEDEVLMKQRQKAWDDQKFKKNKAKLERDLAIDLRRQLLHGKLRVSEERAAAIYEAGKKAKIAQMSRALGIKTLQPTKSGKAKSDTGLLVRT